MGSESALVAHAAGSKRNSMHMLYRITYNGEAIGTSQLAFRDSAMAVAFGEFDSLPSYGSVRPVFLMFTSAQSERDPAARAEKLSPYFSARDFLPLALQ